MSELGSVGVRKEPFDRTFADAGVLAFQSNAVAPHASTQRWTFTVPSNKRAYLQYAQCIVQRATAPTNPAVASSSVRYTPSGGAIRDVVVATDNSPATPAKDSATLDAAIVLQAGDVVAGFTADASVNGTINYWNDAQIGQFDV